MVSVVFESAFFGGGASALVNGDRMRIEAIIQVTVQSILPLFISFHPPRLFEETHKIPANISYDG